MTPPGSDELPPPFRWSDPDSLESRTHSADYKRGWNQYHDRMVDYLKRREMDTPLYVNPYLVGAVWALGVALLAEGIVALFGMHLSLERAVLIGGGYVCGAAGHAAFDWVADRCKR